MEAKIRQKNSTTINKLSKERKEVVGFCRFLNNDKVDWESIHKDKSKDLDNKCEGMHVLVVNDTTELNYEKHRNYLNEEDGELGPVTKDNNIGFFCHPGIVINAANGVAMGYSYLNLWNRRFDKKNKKERDYKNQPIEEKESYRWIECGIESKERLKKAKEITIIADRESDIYEEFKIVPDERTNLIIRSRGDRATQESESLYKQIDSTEVKGSYKLKVRNTGKRQGRNTELEVKFKKVKIRKPKNRRISGEIPAYIELTAVEAKEINKNVPKGEEPIHWILLTTHEVKNIEDALQIIVWYSMRWQIELLFATMKSKGMNIEASELESGKALKSMCVLAIYVSLLINQLRQYRDDTSGISAAISFTEKQIELLKILSKEYEGNTEKQKNPHKERTMAWAAWTIARLGGWKGYSCECPPGNKTFKWGLDTFDAMYQGFIIREKICA